MQFLGTDIYPLLAAARARLGAFLNADPDDLAFVTNATTGVNIVARSLALHPGDEILTTDHEYGACVNAWQAVCQKTERNWWFGLIDPCQFGRCYRRTILGRRHTTHQTDFHQPYHIGHGTDPARRGNLRPRPRRPAY